MSCMVIVTSCKDSMSPDSRLKLKAVTGGTVQQKNVEAAHNMSCKLDTKVVFSRSVED